jgi:hypothetical protein
MSKPSSGTWPYVAAGMGGFSPRITRETIPEPPAFLKKFYGEVPQAVGGEVGALAGGTAGFAIAGPIGVVPGAIAGAFLGGAGGKGYQQSYKMFKGTSDAPSSFGEIYKEQLFAGGEEAIAEGVGRGLAGGASRLAAPFRSKLIKQAPEMAALAKRYGTHMTPGQLLDSWVADTAETVADASFFGGRRMKTLKIRAQPEAIGRYADDIGEMFAKKAGTSLDPDTIGRFVDDALGTQNKAFMAQAKALYGKVDELTKTATVDISALKKFATERLAESQDLAGIGASEAGDTLLSKIQRLGAKPEGDDALGAFAALFGEEISESGNEISFKAAQELRSRLLREETSLAATKDKARGIAKKLIGLTDQAIDASGSKLTPEGLQGFRLANRFYKQGKEKYANAVIRNLIQTVEKRGEPEKIIPYIFQNKAVSRIKKTKAALGADSTAWASLKAKYVEGLLAAKPGKVTGTNIPTALFNMGDNALKEIFNPTELTAIRRLGDWATLVTGKASSEMATGGSLVVQLVQGGAILSLVSGQFQEIATPVFVVPEVISQLASRPGPARWLTAGFDLPANSPAGMAVAARLATLVRRAESNIHKKRQSKPMFQSSRPVSGHHF